jgi:Prenyltransferase and squalene oxidase repeat
MLNSHHMLIRPLARLSMVIASLSAGACFGQVASVTSVVESSEVEVVVDAQRQELIDGALRWLATQQAADGSWNRNGSDRAAITAYVLHAYMAAGHLPGEGKFGPQLTRALDFMISRSRQDGYLGFDGGRMYGHGISTIVLGELYGQSNDPRLKDVVQRALDVIVRSQSPRGGWRYEPEPIDDDVSVTVLQLVALRVGRNAGFAVPQSTIDRAIEYIRICRHEQTGGFQYRPNDGAPGFARTAAAIYSLQVCGIYRDEAIQGGQKYMERNFGDGQQWYTYGQFYAMPAMYMIGGDAWKRWYDHVTARFVKEAKRQGDLVFWQALDRDNGDDRVYPTAVYAASLAIPLGYLPIYQR